MPDNQEVPDILLYTGYDIAELLSRAPTAVDLVDAVITGPFDIRQPTTLIWRGSANQTLHLLTPLARIRYEMYVDHRPEKPDVQVLVGDHDIWYVGVPRAGDLARVDCALRRQGVTAGGASWKP